jgi:hypothetical protein
MHEGAPNQEQKEKFSSKIELNFFRHNDKEKNADKSKTDEEVLLTDGGRMDAISHAEDTDISQSVAFGSPRMRTQETAALHMAGAMEEITGEETLEQLKAKINAGRDATTKLTVDPRLNFVLEEGKNEYVDAAYKAFGEGRLMKFLVEESDQLAEKAGDNESSTFSRQAANVASIISKYLTIAPRFDGLVNGGSNTGQSFEDTMKRFMGTHQSVCECFLAKVIEKTKGVEARDAFVKAVNNKGFDFSEGFKLELVTNSPGEEPKIKIEYKREAKSDGKETEDNNFEFNEEISKGVIEEIVKEG